MNKYRLVVRLFFLVMLVLTSAMSVQVFAAVPDGLAPGSGVWLDAAASETCTSQTLGPGAQMWFQVPYHTRTDLEIYARGNSPIDFAVFDPRQVSTFPLLEGPVGHLTPNPNEPQYLKSWVGHLWLGVESGMYYVRASNNLAWSAGFSLCTAEREQYLPPPDPMPIPAAVPTECPVAGTGAVTLPICP